jgi:hypothetical protein
MQSEAKDIQTGKWKEWWQNSHQKLGKSKDNEVVFQVIKEKNPLCKETWIYSGKISLRTEWKW